MAVYVTVLALVFGFAVPASAEDRPSDPFGNHTRRLLSFQYGKTLKTKCCSIRLAFTLALNLAMLLVQRYPRS